MANVKLPASIWVDLNTATGFAVGNILDITNITPNDVRVVTKATEPDGTDDHLPVLFRGPCVTSGTGDPKSWALCVGGGAINVVDKGV